MKKRLKSVRIDLPKGTHYDILTIVAKLHGAPSLSKYILNAAMTYSTDYIERKKDELDKRKEEGSSLRNPSGDDIGDTDPDGRSDNRASGGPGIIPSTSDNGDGPAD